MAGKPYTMREMRSIVEYLVERKAYGEIKGRKMWMEFASTKSSRTWQSLKETFLKRILPDIRNPYYRLTMDQAQSFRTGYDVAEKEKNNRLEFRTASGESNSIKAHENQNDLSTTNKNIDVPTSSKNLTKENDINEVPASSIDEALEKATGEGITAAKIPSRCRSSADTLVLEYENAEDIQRDLESPPQSIYKENKKSLKDKLIFEYSAPLTPAVKDLLDDFETESECSDKEPESRAAENIPTVEIPDSQPVPDALENIKLEDEIENNDADSTIEISDSDNVSSNINDKNNPSAVDTSQKDTTSKNDKPSENVQESSSSKSKIDDINLRNTDVNDIREHGNNNINSNAETTARDTTEVLSAESGSKTINKTSDKTNTDDNSIPNTGTSTQNMSSDTFIPNNQEALNVSKKSNNNENPEETLEKSKLSLKRPAKRSASQENRDSNKVKSTEDNFKENETEANILIIDLNSPEQENAPKVDDNAVSIKHVIVEPNNTNSSEQEDTHKVDDNAGSIKHVIVEPNNTNSSEQEDTHKVDDNAGSIKHVIFEPNNTNSSEQEDTPKVVDNAGSIKHVVEPNNTKSNLNNTNQSSTSKTVTKNNNELTTNTEIDVNVDDKKQEVNPKDINPCLMSVSLFEEQFNNTKYSDSEPDDVMQPQQKENTENPLVAREKKETKDKPQSVNIEESEKPKAVSDKKNDKETKTQVVMKTENAEVNNKKETGKKTKLEPSKKKEPELNTNVTLMEDAETDILDSGSNSEPQAKGVVKNVQHASTSVNALDSSSDVVLQTKGVVKNVQHASTSVNALDSSSDLVLQTKGVVRNVHSRTSADRNAERERAIANVFGFANGGAPSSRKRCISHRRRSHHHRRTRQSTSASSNSSEWISENDSDYISPPRGRRNRSTKKYLKPKRSRILQDPEEGMLYVIIDKNIYPLVKHGHQGMNFLTYHPEDDGAETYWKQKYIDEKQRVDRVKRLLKESQRQSIQTHDLTGPSTSRNSAPKSPKKTAVNGNIEESVDLTVEKPKAKDEKMVLKIATKTGVECCLEGDWNQISHAMPQVVKLLHSDVTTNGSSKISLNGGAESKVQVEMQVRSGEITPIDPEAHEKVDKLESEIFSKIEALAKEDGGKENESDTANVTKRRTLRRRNESSTSSIIVTKSPAKRSRTSKTISIDSKQESSTETKRSSKTQLEETKRNEELESKTERKDEERSETTEEIEKPKRRGRKKIEKVETEEPDVIETKKSRTKNKTDDSKSPSRTSSRLSKQRDLSESGKSAADDNSSVGRRPRQLRTPKKYEPEPTTSKQKASAKSSKESELFGIDDKVRFKFPPREASTSKTSVKSAGNTGSLPEINIIPPTEDLRTVTDTTGYLDSDASPLKLVLLKRKRRVSYISRKIISNRRLTRRRSVPMFLEEFSTDSSASSYFIPLRRSPSIRSSAESDIPLTGKQNISRSNLERIEELTPQDIDQPTSQNEPGGIRHFNSVSKDATTLTLNSNDLTEILLEVGSSSSISLPLSPELSLVENLSISREMIKQPTSDHPTINEVQQNNRSCPMDYTDYMISNVDVSVPLMDQQCQLQKNNEASQNENKTDEVIKDCTVNLTLSKSLDQRMKDLLLESAQKMVQANSRRMPMEVDQTPITKKPRVRNRKINVDMDVEQSKVETSKKTRAKKRSSTPQKKKPAPKSKAPKDAIIEEEHMEFCSSGRQSCPPVINFVSVDENANSCSDVTLAAAKPKAKPKKDIIRVKIQRPGDKTGSKNKKPEKSPVHASVNTDSGINDSESALLFNGDSVDLIHNHSETCLMDNDECMLNSLEFVENSSVSVVSLSSSRQSEDSMFYKLFGEPAASSEGTSNYRDNDVAEQVASDDNFQTADTVFLSPVISNSSLITEDLSNSPKPSKWYLLEEDITNQESSNPSGSGSNLHHIFPIACAVPNLSTISETSKDNEDSRKASLDSVK